MLRAVHVAIVTLLVAGSALGATITVRKDGTGDFAVIQQALNVAAAGDTILIGPGEYLDKTWIRFPAWSHDIESFANVTVDNLTIIGAGADQTLIGPTTYSGNTITESPMVMTYIEGADLRLEGVCLRNSDCGLYMSGRLFMDRCDLSNNRSNVAWFAVGSGGWIRDSQFDVVTPLGANSIRIMDFGGAADILVENCSVQHSLTVIDGVDRAVFRNCNLFGSALGLQVYGSARVTVDGCVVSGASTGGIELTAGSAAVCEILNSEVSGGQVALAAVGNGSNCRFLVSQTRLRGGTYAIIYADFGAGVCSISGCDLEKGSGPTVRCGSGGANLTHDFRNNYWGTSNEADIQSWIIDHNDNAAVGATVLYSPFAGQSVPSETTTWGDLKALFR